MFPLKRICCKLLDLASALAAVPYRAYLLVCRAVDLSLSARLSIWHAGNVAFGRNVIIERACLLHAPGKSKIALGDGVTIMHGSQLITHNGSITIGRGTAVNRFSILYGQGGLTIGSNCLIGAMCVFVPANHRFDDPRIPIRQQGETRQGIVIGDNCWLGTRVTVLDGVTIGDNCVIGAGAVVTRSIAADSIAVGVPARVVRSRVAVVPKPIPPHLPTSVSLSAR